MAPCMHVDVPAYTQGVMTPQHLAAANAALDELEMQGIIRPNEDGTCYSMEYNSMMTMDPPFSTPFREMLAHPAIGKRYAGL